MEPPSVTPEGAVAVLAESFGVVAVVVPVAVGSPLVIGVSAGCVVPGGATTQ